MKKIFLAFVAILMIGACGFIPTPPSPTATAVIESLTAAPADTSTIPPTETAVHVEEASATPEPPPLNPTITPFLPDNLTTTPATATLEAATATPTAVSFSATTTASPTLGVLTYGTLPPRVPSVEVVLVNKSKAEAYISLQNQEKNGAILEYPVKTQVSVRAPLGQYIYVAWVGGNKMTGSFALNNNGTAYIYIYKEKVVIQQ